jgi:hypothetical protein
VLSHERGVSRDASGEDDGISAAEYGKKCNKGEPDVFAALVIAHAHASIEGIA